MIRHSHKLRVDDSILLVDSTVFSCWPWRNKLLCCELNQLLESQSGLQLTASKRLGLSLYNHKHRNSANNLREFESEFFPRWASGREHCLTSALIADWWNSEAGNPANPTLDSLLTEIERQWMCVVLTNKLLVISYTWLEN